MRSGSLIRSKNLERSPIITELIESHLLVQPLIHAVCDHPGPLFGISGDLARKKPVDGCYKYLDPSREMRWRHRIFCVKRLVYRESVAVIDWPGKQCLF